MLIQCTKKLLDQLKINPEKGLEEEETLFKTAASLKASRYPVGDGKEMAIFIPRSTAG